ncbi:hypothetical protein [Paenibacillus sp. BAC0078]
MKWRNSTSVTWKIGQSLVESFIPEILAAEVQKKSLSDCPAPKPVQMQNNCCAVI